MHVRQGEKQDSEILARLIFDSAPSSLSAAFDIDTEYSAQNFLKKSLLEPEGQYGYKNHWVMVKDEHVIACISAWHSQLPQDFHRATLSSIATFYGIRHSLTVLHTNQAIQDCVPQIHQNEWCIGHLAVLKKHQKQGIATALIELMQQQALKHKKSFISLDVVQTNQTAINFYLQQGFVQKNESGVSSQMQALGIGAHFHLSKSV